MVPPGEEEGTPPKCYIFLFIHRVMTENDQNTPRVFCKLSGLDVVLLGHVVLSCFDSNLAPRVELGF